MLQRFRSLKDSKTTQENSSAISQKEPEQLTIKQKTGDAANKWLAKNRSLVLRQTPVWAQSLAGILIGLGVISIVGGMFTSLSSSRCFGIGSGSRLSSHGYAMMPGAAQDWRSILLRA